jgi:hypothetical protein
MAGHRIGVVLGGCVLLLAFMEVAAHAGRDPVDRVVLVGDSIALEASPYFEERVDGLDLVEHLLIGTAPCDWPIDGLGVEEGDLVVVSFTGNSRTPCMSDGAGGQLQGDAVAAKYEDDVRSLVDGIRVRGADVLLVGQPERGPGTTSIGPVAGINAVYRTLAEEDGVSFVDAGAALETEDGAYAGDLPCLPSEKECGPSGRNVVRNPDGVHLCPQSHFGPCPVYASGAFRFADAIVAAIESR